jgi:LDH2 family malate/lactate/ureidoglycolate dehydrogenase
VADQEILMPGELEARTRVERLANGIPLDTQTCSQLRAACNLVGANSATIDRVCDDDGS